MPHAIDYRDHPESICLVIFPLLILNLRIFRLRLM